MTFLEILILIIAITLSIIAVRISFKFDINRFLENRRKIKLDQLKNICPHLRISPDKGNSFIIESFFFISDWYSPMDLFSVWVYCWVTGRCGQTY